MAVESPGEPVKLLFVCTGNAARSVMAAVMARNYSDLFDIRGAGTHAIEGCPMGRRTRESLASLGLADPDHRSVQLVHENSSWADLIVAMASDHVAYVRRSLPEYAHKTATLKRFVRDVPVVTDSQRGDLRGWLHQELARLELAEVELADWESVEDPASGELPDFMETLAEIHQLMDEFLVRFHGVGYEPRAAGTTMSEA